MDAAAAVLLAQDSSGVSVPWLIGTAIGITALILANSRWQFSRLDSWTTDAHKEAAATSAQAAAAAANAKAARELVTAGSALLHGVDQRTTEMAGRC